MRKLIFIVISVFLLSACSHHERQNTIRIGTIAGPETSLMQVAKEVALKRYGLHVDIVQFSDYIMPNAALADGSIDANMFQHIPYLKQAEKQHHYKFSVIGKTFVYPMGIYSQKIKSLKNVKDNDVIAIPNDPSNEARALLLLQKAHLITLKAGSTINATLLDVASNPKHLTLKELDAAQLPRVLPDVALAVINTNYAIPAGLHPSQALLAEDGNSPYANVVVIRTNEKGQKKFKELVAALHSPQVLAKAKALFGDGAIAAFKVDKENQAHH